MELWSCGHSSKTFIAIIEIPVEDSNRGQAHGDFQNFEDRSAAASNTDSIDRQVISIMVNRNTI